MMECVSRREKLKDGRREKKGEGRGGKGRGEMGRGKKGGGKKGGDGRR